jgi:ABC-type branched-subunit amino acid transport system substrate-binding protein
LSRKWTAPLLALGLIGAACGARVPPYLGAGAGGVQPGAGNPQTTTGSGGGPGGQTGSQSTGGGLGGNGTANTVAGGGTSGNGGGGGGSQAQTSGPTGGVAALTPQNFPFDPAAQAALCQGSAGNTASDKGVTPTSISVGNVSGLTGVLLNNFNQGPEAVQALFSAVNAAGGICGRKLNLIVEDDGQDSTKDASDIADEIPRVIAFAGSTSDADNGGVNEMAAAKVPDLGPAISANRGQSPMFWAPTGATQYIQNGHAFIFDSLTNGLKDNNDFPTRLASLAYQIPISEQAAKEFTTLFTRAGAVSCFTDYSILPTTTSLDGDVIQMKNNHCDGVYTTMDVTGNAKLYQAMQRQQFKPRFNATTFDGYTPAQISVAGQSAAQGLQVTLPFLPFNDGNPIVNLYLSQLKTWEPGKEPSGFGMDAWAGAQMLIYGLLKAGRNPTRASLVSAFAAIDSWNTGGATSPDTPRTRLPAGPCIMQTSVQGNDFVRAWPKSGFYCNGKLVDLGPVPS